MNKYEQVIAELGLTIPEPATPVANFFPYVVTGKLVYISGQIPVQASDLIVSVFGERGRHARAAVGVNSLPGGVAVEVDAIFEIA